MKTAQYGLFLATFVSSIAFGAWSDMASASFSIEAPPAIGSTAYQQDFATLLQLQQGRSSEQCRLASTQLFPEYRAFFKSSGLLNDVELANAASLVSRSMKLTERVTTYFKDQANRPRPFNVDSRIQPCIQRPQGSKSYPSSHASTAATAACVLAEIYPSRAKQLYQYGQFLGDLRVVVGVHHPSDVKAGQSLGREVCARLLNDSEFRSELQSIRKF